MQDDLKVLMFLRNQGQYMGVIPADSRYKTLSCVIRVICAIALMSISYEVLALRFPFYSRLPITCLVMDISAYYIGYIYLAVFCLAQNCNYNHWQEMEKIVFKTEALLNRTRFTVPNKNFFLKYIMINLLYILLHGYQQYLWIKYEQLDLILSYIPFRFVHYWISFLPIVIYQWIQFLTRRYIYLSKYLNQIFSNRIIIVHQAKKELRMVGEIYKQLSDIAGLLNTIFSVHLFFLMFMSMAVILNASSILTVSFKLFEASPSSYAVAPLIFVNVLVVAISYENLQEKSRNVIKTCLLLQEEMVQGQLRADLSFLTKYIKKLRPKISAFGFFELGFGLITGFISTVFAYYIIILQFTGASI